MTDLPSLPDGVTRRMFLEDVLDAMGTADAIDLGDGTEVTKADLLRGLAQEMDSD